MRERKSHQTKVMEMEDAASKLWFGIRGVTCRTSAGPTHPTSRLQLPVASRPKLSILEVSQSTSINHHATSRTVNMGLVDYASDSDSDSAPAASVPKQSTTSTSKKPFQKVVDRSNPGKILVNLPQAATTSSSSNADEPPAKRARTGDGSGGRFSGFNSFLPPPKNANKPKPAVSGGARSRPGINLKTSSAAAFSRDIGDGVGDLFGGDHGEDAGSNASLSKKQDGPSIPAEQKPAEEVKLVGKPMMFRPLSVSRNPKKKKAMPAAPAKSAVLPAETASSATATTTPTEPAQPPPPPKKVSLFSMHTEEPSQPTKPSSGTYEPLFATQGPAPAPSDQPDPYETTTTAAANSSSLDTIANDLNLSASERRELFGRNGGGGQTAKSVINFNMDREYQHNEALRASGEQQIHNPVRAIQGGKHSLRQLVSNVQNQKEALEDSFAKGKNNRKEASGKYGW